MRVSSSSTSWEIQRPMRSSACSRTPRPASPTRSARPSPTRRVTSTCTWTARPSSLGGASGMLGADPGAGPGDQGLHAMNDDLRIDLLARVARSAARHGQPVDPARPVSILSLAAASYGARPSEDATVPTGFDPLAVALFEAIVEGAYLGAHADGVFDDEERRTFERVVLAACGGTVAPQQIAALVSDLSDQLAEDGLDRRVAALAKTASKREHAQEVLRVAALLAQ